ncbi:MAG: hypothetical protein A2V67_06965 [Deltaproteobacteria bacterium RBG_13_61_14]|nr:MAG: hypothetical protein A2V67_06965 [Deltaproteobacteria bacterium RBG_13_61_14]
MRKQEEKEESVKQGWTEMERLTGKTRFLILAGPRAMANRKQRAILKIVQKQEVRSKLPIFNFGLAQFIQPPYNM